MERERARVWARERLWLTYLAANVVAIAAFVAVPHAAKEAVEAVIAVAAVTAVVVGARRNRGDRAQAWILIAVGLGTFVAGEAVSGGLQVATHRATFPSPGDVVYLAGCVPLVLGIFRLIASDEPGRGAETLLDAALVTAGAGVGLWVFLVAPHISVRTELAAQAMAAAFPLVDLLILAMITRLVLTSARRASAYTFLCASFCALLTSDTAYLFATMHRWYQLGNVLDAGWLVAYVLLGVAALHPSRPQVREETTDENPGRITHARLTTLALMSFVAPAILAVQALRHEALHVPSIVVAEMAVSLLIIARMAGLASALEAAAFNDHLTGLPNRRLLHDRLRQALVRSERSHDPVAVLFVDLGRFKAVNDKLGHKFGDDVLVELGGRMRSIVRTEDTVARFGGDEFVIVCEGLDVLGVTNVGDRIREALARPIVIGGESVTLSVDVGIAMARPGCNDAEALLAQADLAMYRAKEEARGTEPQVEQVDQPV